FRTPASYTGSWLVCGFDLAASIATLPPTAPQRLEGMTFDEHGLEETSTARLSSASRAGQVLTPETIEQARREAIADWITTGLTPVQILALQNATVQITDLNSEGAFGFAGSRLIQLDDDALGFGWHVGSGPVPTGAVDLGTVLRHELGHILGYSDLDPATAGDDIMSGTILPGERRGVTSVGSAEVALREDLKRIGVNVGLKPDPLQHSVELTPATSLIDPELFGMDKYPVATPSVPGRSPTSVSHRDLPAELESTVNDLSDSEELDLLDSLFTDALTRLLDNEGI
ncbi:MAG: hypothetical protein ACKO3T_22895, partial [Planctomycetaceae bacterium]